MGEQNLLESKRPRSLMQTHSSRVLNKTNPVESCHNGSSSRLALWMGRASTRQFTAASPTSFNFSPFPSALTSCQTEHLTLLAGPRKEAEVKGRKSEIILKIHDKLNFAAASY